MDRKKTQRILGILVIIALVIILFPLLFGKNEPPTQTSNIEAPPFPEQTETATVTTAEGSEAVSPPLDANDAAPSKLDVSSASDRITPPSDATNDSAQPTTIEPDMASHSSATSKINDVDPPLFSKTITADEGLPFSSEANAENKSSSIVKMVEGSAPASEVNKPIQPAKAVKRKETVRPASAQLTHKDLPKLNAPAWVVQMGSFKEKGNARHLADRLRSAGYNAFIKEVKSAKGNTQTRVYIGPEFKWASAKQTSAKVQEELNLQGFVISYKPLAM